MSRDPRLSERTLQWAGVQELIFGLEGSQAVPARPSGKVKVFD
jgi:hypothetical protein